MASPREYVNDPRFTRIFDLPPDATRGRSKPFRIAYADYGYRNEALPEQDNVLLFFGSLMGSRLIHIAKDELAKVHKVRVINPDRPGIGGTDAAEAEHRMGLWLDAIPALLDHLGIKHISVACHSCGVIYALDLMLHHPGLLHPERPYLAIGAPWILPVHTGSTALRAAQSLPAGIIGQTDKLARLINNHVGPLAGTSIGLILGLVAKLSPPSHHVSENASGEASFEHQIWPAIVERMYAEGVRGIADDAVLLMQKHGSKVGWSNWGDYDTLVPRLAEALRAAGRRLKVDVFYAGNDHLIGSENSKGRHWFDDCWGVPQGSDIISFHCMTVNRADHDEIWSMRFDAIYSVFRALDQQVESSQIHG